MSSPHKKHKCSIHIFHYSLIIPINIHIQCVDKIQTLNDKPKLRIVTTVPERTEEGETMARLRWTILPLLPWAPWGYILARLQNILWNDNSDIPARLQLHAFLNGNTQIKLHYQTYLQKKAQENDISFIVFWNQLKETTFFVMEDTFNFFKRNGY